jgi:putative PEP-CTERM system histidine kinase
MTHDYRAHWLAFAQRIAARPNVDTMCGDVAEDIRAAIGAPSVAIYVLNASATAFRLCGQAGGGSFTETVESEAVVHSARATDAVVTPPGAAGVLGIALRAESRLLGFIVVTPRTTGDEYTGEDTDFLGVMAQQMAGWVLAMTPGARESAPSGRSVLPRLRGGVVHDLKNSVAALSLLARNAREHFGDPEFQRDAAATLSSTVERMQRLIAKLAAPTPSPSHAEPIDLHQLIIQATTPLAADRKVRLVRQLRHVNAMYGDREIVQRVVENLATNAAEAIRDEGTVTVTLTEEQGQAVISVADTGCGIPQTFRESALFAPFRTTKKDGWGVGLYETRQAVESQAGQISVESVEGKGTTFTVRLPLRALP